MAYLSRYVVATRCRQRLNHVVFLRHSKASRLVIEVWFCIVYYSYKGTSRNLINFKYFFIKIQELPLALAEILGFHLKKEESDLIFNLISDLSVVKDISQEEFAGIAGAINLINIFKNTFSI